MTTVILKDFRDLLWLPDSHYKPLLLIPLKISIKVLTDLHFREGIKSSGVQNTNSDIELNLDSGAYACCCNKN